MEFRPVSKESGRLCSLGKDAGADLWWKSVEAEKTEIG